MKKIVMMLAAVLCCTIIPTGGVQAQDGVNTTFTVTQGKKNTIRLYGDNNWIDPYTPYQGEELHAGRLSFIIKLEADIETDDAVVPPANLLFHVSFTDPYGRVPYLYESNEILSKLFHDLKYFDGYLVEDEVISGNVCRGGQYVYRNYIPGLDYKYEENVELKDEPSVRVRYNSVKVGNDIVVKTFYNTGYPYDVNQFNGSEKATLRFFAIGKDDKGDPKDTEVVMMEKPLRLYRPDQPLVAALDSMILCYCDPEPGLYRLKMESNWAQEGANRENILISVNDTVRCHAELNKSKYVAGKDTGLKLHVKLNYGYPYVQGEDSKVLINTSVMTGEDKDAKTILSGTNSIWGEGLASLADHPLDWEGDINAADYIEEQDNAPLADTTLYVKMEVVFNGESQYTKVIPFDYIAEAPPTGVKAITDNLPADDHWYDIQGTRMDSKPIQNGVYIQNHKKVIVK